jgi:large subunit ribosomal protein L30
MYAVIRLRGTVNLAPKARKTLDLLGLKRINNLSLQMQNESSRKMIKMVEDFVTYGEIDDATLKELIEKRATPLEGKKVDTKKVLADLKAGKTIREAGVRNLFTMSPPQGGFERKGIKVPYKIGGALGYRKEAINELIKKML